MQTVNARRLRSLLTAFRSKRILVLGDAILDQYLWGSVSRISPEAPVPVVEVNRETFVPGGAANVARNITSLGGHAEFISVIGRDAMGAKLKELLREERVVTEHAVVQHERPTAVKSRVIAQKQQMIRIDREDRTALNGETTRQVVAQLAQALPGSDAVILVDYDKGFLTQGLLDQAMKLARRARKIVTVDPKPSHSLRMSGMTAIKPNRSEAYAFSGAGRDASIDEVGQRLLRKWRPRHLLVSLGSEGLALFESNRKAFRIPTMAREVFDVSGAGDTTMAVFTLALAAGARSIEAAIIANHAAGVVVGKVGTATVSPEELIASFERER
ncbi:MAG: D-glycero-beta-D-manno-heptose-7-phosphate kinase [Verrucomicrobiae bacterium]|nr:D-glycero-beta-D-manno-heptose-7-phosphate kinase [Verrucomicrobiae bacterium]